MDEVHSQFSRNIDEKKLLWQEVAIRELAVLINVSVEAPGQKFLCETKLIIPQVEKLLTAVQFKKEDENSVDLVSRIMNLLSKLTRDQRGVQQIAENKNLIFRSILYFNKAAYPQDIVMNSLRVIHNCCKSAENFRTICLDKHAFNMKIFDTLVSDSLSIF